MARNDDNQRDDAYLDHEDMIYKLSPVARLIAALRKLQSFNTTNSERDVEPDVRIPPEQEKEESGQ